MGPLTLLPLYLTCLKMEFYTRALQDEAEEYILIHVFRRLFHFCLRVKEYFPSLERHFVNQNKEPWYPEQMLELKGIRLGTFWFINLKSNFQFLQQKLTVTGVRTTMLFYAFIFLSGLGFTRADMGLITRYGVGTEEMESKEHYSVGISLTLKAKAMQA